MPLWSKSEDALKTLCDKSVLIFVALLSGLWTEKQTSDVKSVGVQDVFLFCFLFSDSQTQQADTILHKWVCSEFHFWQYCSTFDSHMLESLVTLPPAQHQLILTTAKVCETLPMTILCASSQHVSMSPKQANLLLWTLQPAGTNRHTNDYYIYMYCTEVHLCFCSHLHDDWAWPCQAVVLPQDKPQENPTHLLVKSHLQPWPLSTVPARGHGDHRHQEVMALDWARAAQGCRLHHQSYNPLGPRGKAEAWSTEDKLTKNFESRNEEDDTQLGHHPEAGQWQTEVKELRCCPICQLAWQIVMIMMNHLHENIENGKVQVNAPKRGRKKTELLKKIPDDQSKTDMW